MLKFFVLLLLSAGTLKARVIVISDIDDTLKFTHGMSSKSVLSYFKNESNTYEDFMILSQELKAQKGQFLYLSSSYQGIYDAPKWLAENGFPEGRTIQRNEDSYLDGALFKEEELAKIFEHQEIMPEDKFYFFGDNLGGDDEVYRRIVQKYNLANQATIIVRDVLLNQTLFGADTRESSVQGVHFFVSGKELGEVIFPMLLSGEISIDAYFLLTASFYQRRALNEFQIQNLKQRLKGRYCSMGDLSCGSMIVHRVNVLTKEYYELN